MAPINLSQTAQYATLVFNAVQQLRTEEFGEILKEQLGRVFPSREYVLFVPDQLDAGAEDSYTKLNAELNKRVSRDSSLDVPGKDSFLLVFYEAAETLTQARLNGILDLVSKAEANYANTISLLCVDKTDQAMDNLLKAAKELEGNTRISMVLCDTPNLSSCVGGVRALVRYIHCLSRNNGLCNELCTDRAGQMVFVTMSEFDEEGYAKDTQRLEEIERELKKSEPFPHGVLNGNFNKIEGEEKERFRTFANLTAEQVPVPEGAVSRRFSFRNETADLKRSQLQQALEYTYAHGVWEVYLTGLQERAAELCKKLIEGISVGDLSAVKDNCKTIRVSGEAANWSCQLTAAYNMKELLEQITNQLNKAKNAYTDALPGEVLGAIQAQLGQVLTEESIESKRVSLVKEKNTLVARMYPGVRDAETYWQNVDGIMGKLSARLSLICWVSEKAYVLIPDNICKNWGSYSGFAWMDNRAVNPYNCNELDEQEFQVLRVKYFTREQLAKGMGGRIHEKSL